MPLPVLFAGEVTVSHEALLIADQPQPEPVVVTLKLPVPAAVVNAWPGEDNWNEHVIPIKSKTVFAERLVTERFAGVNWKPVFEGVMVYMPPDCKSPTE